MARKFPFPRVNNISPARTRLLDTDYEIVCRIKVFIKSSVDKRGRPKINPGSSFILLLQAQDIVH